MQSWSLRALAEEHPDPLAGAASYFRRCFFLHLIKKIQVAVIKTQPSKSNAITFGEKLYAEKALLLPMGISAIKTLTQKSNPQAQIVIVFRFMISSDPLLPQSPL
jgi:hypothetical protein